MKRSQTFRLPRVTLSDSSTDHGDYNYGSQYRGQTNGHFQKNDIQDNSISYSVYKGQDSHLETNETLDENEPIKESEDNEERGTWGRQLEFLLSCIAMSVGLGNVWRFPYVAFENGGGAFVIIYLFLLFLIGRPLYYLELILGQFSGSGPIRVWSCVPFLRGIGYAQMVSTFYIMVYYNFLMAITVFYIFASMQKVLPWTECDRNWATDGCNVTETNTSLTEQYFNNYVLKKSSGLDEVTSIDPWLVLCLLFAWICVFFSIIKGVESAGKVAYFTALFPYTILIALLIVALLQEGSVEGIKYFLDPDWTKLKDPLVWYNACEQSFFSLAVGFGALIMYSSYNDFKHNIYRDAIIISVTDTFTSILAGCVIFSVLGTLATSKGISVADTIKETGPGLAFVAYPEALGKITFVPQLWSVLFFFMIFTLGIGSSVAQVETILTPLRDKFPVLRKQKWKLAAVMCCISFICGLPLATDGGQYILKLMDNYGVGTAAFLYGIVEVIGIMWIYGYKSFRKDVHFMLGSKPGIYWSMTWFFITPVALLVIFIYGNYVLSQAEPAPGIPAWGNAIGWVLAMIAIGQIPVWAIWTFVKNKHFSKNTGIEAPIFSPSEKWGPRSAHYRLEWQRFKRDQKPNPEIQMEPPPPYDNYGFDALDEHRHSSPSTSWDHINSSKD